MTVHRVLTADKSMLLAMQVDLWKTSGHFDFYGENMFDQMKVENEEYQLRPMNCPFHIAIYKACRLLLSALACKCTPITIAHGGYISAGRVSLVQRFAAPLGRAWHRVPVRAVWHHARAVPCPRLHSGLLGGPAVCASTEPLQVYVP